MTTKREEAVFLLKPWKRSLHPGTHREHYKHKMNAIKASSSYMLRDALIPVKERSSYKHPVLGENIFDFERKIERTENPFRKEALLEKIKEMHQKDGQRERHYYVANDIFGAYNRKKIKAKFPYVFSFFLSTKRKHKLTFSLTHLGYLVPQFKVIMREISGKIRRERELRIYIQNEERCTLNDRKAIFDLHWNLSKETRMLERSIDSSN